MLCKRQILSNHSNVIKIHYFSIELKIKNMFKKFTTTDKLLFVAALLSLIFAEVLFFQGNTAEGTFIGLWVPSILAFGIYLKLINNKKND